MRYLILIILFLTFVGCVPRGHILNEAQKRFPEHEIFQDPEDDSIIYIRNKVGEVHRIKYDTFSASPQESIKVFGSQFNPLGTHTLPDALKK